MGWEDRGVTTGSVEEEEDEDEDDFAIFETGEEESREGGEVSVTFHRVRNSFTSMKIPAPASGVAARPRSETTTTGKPLFCVIEEETSSEQRSRN